jgi:glycine/D-amino acid oxidase-like deaminating enzyme
LAGSLTQTSDFDVVVVGSGAMGSSIAYHLALLKPDLKVGADLNGSHE